MIKNNGNDLPLLNSAELESVGRKVMSLVTFPECFISVSNLVSAEASFVSNDMRELSSARGTAVTLKVSSHGRQGSSATTNIDPESLARLVQETEDAAMAHVSPGRGLELVRPQSFIEPVLYYNVTLQGGMPESQGNIMRQMAETVEHGNLMGAGNLKVQAIARVIMNSLGLNSFTRSTYTDYSVTVKTKSYKGSGWAWSGNEDFSRLDPLEVTNRAMELAHKSDNPVAVEPGRYTVILEPEALAPFVNAIIGPPTSSMSMSEADEGRTIFSKIVNNRLAGTKIGEQIVDRRMQMSHDPMDAELPYSSLSGDGHVIKPVQWFVDGVLQTLAYGPGYAKKKRLSREYVDNPGRARVEFKGVSSNVADMISSTKRGIWVHRFGSLDIVNTNMLLLTGVTRDGTFLIENGQVTKAIKNLRFLESPFFVLNKVEAFGTPVRASENLSLPRIMVRDFEFTSLTEAV